LQQAILPVSAVALKNNFPAADSAESGTLVDKCRVLLLHKKNGTC
jgi:hypothetical protein